MITELTKKSQYMQDFIPCLDILDRQAWESLPESLKRQLIENGEAYTGYIFPPLTASDYMEFTENGNRSRYEEKMFARRRVLGALVLAECIENQGRFLKDIVNGIYLLLEESTWCIPAHNTYIRDTPQKPLPDYSRPIIDLFAAETGAILSVAEYLLRPALEQISPFISADVNFRLRERIVTPYLTRHFWWMGDGESQMNNWTVWITQNILLTAFTRPDSVLPRDDKEQILSRAARSVDYFLDEYGEDGCCDEGAQYYGRAGISLYHCLDILDRVTGGALDSVFHCPKIRNIADYIRRVHVEDSCYINFADCSLYAGRRGAGEYLFGKRAGLPALSAFAAADFLRDENRLLTEEESLYRRIVQIMHWEEMTRDGIRSSEETLTECSAPIEDVWFESTGLLVSRDARLLLAVKAGNNGDSHNHNDTGSFIVYKDQAPLFIDLGVETYCRKTFSDRRYEIWTMQSQYHNLPSFGGFLQQDGKQYAASRISCGMDNTRTCLTMELAGAYRLEGSSRGCVTTPEGQLVLKDGADQIRSYIRSVSLIKGEKITIEDSYDGDLPAVLNLMTKIRPSVSQISEDTWALDFPVPALCTLTGASSVETETICLTDPKLRDVWGEEVYRLQATLTDHLKLEIQ